MSKGRNQRKKARARQFLTEADIMDNARIDRDLREIHRRANLISERMFDVVDCARTPEIRKLFEGESCRAMGRIERNLKYAPNRGAVHEDWRAE